MKLSSISVRAEVVRPAKVHMSATSRDGGHVLRSMETSSSCAQPASETIKRWRRVRTIGSSASRVRRDARSVVQSYLRGLLTVQQTVALTSSLVLQYKDVTGMTLHLNSCARQYRPAMDEGK